MIGAMAMPQMTTYNGMTLAPMTMPVFQHAVLVPVAMVVNVPSCSSPVPSVASSETSEGTAGNQVDYDKAVEIGGQKKSENFHFWKFEHLEREFYHSNGSAGLSAASTSQIRCSDKKGTDIV